MVNTGQGILGCNMFAHCNNNPVNLIDDRGTIPYRLNAVMMTDGGGKSIRDITIELNELMEDHVNELVGYYNSMFEMYNKAYTLTGGISFAFNNAGASAYIASLVFSRQKETNDGIWDLKKHSIYSSRNQFYYNGCLVSGEDVGNIHFGYVGSSLFPKLILFLGAGLNQAKRDFHLDYLSYWFDEPRDFEMISYGITLYRGMHQ